MNYVITYFVVNAFFAGCLKHHMRLHPSRNAVFVVMLFLGGPLMLYAVLGPAREHVGSMIWRYKWVLIVVYLILLGVILS